MANTALKNLPAAGAETAAADSAPADEAAPQKGMSTGRMVVWGIVIALLIFIMWGLINAFKTPPIIGSTAPDFSMPLYRGQGEFTLSEHRGKVVVINFWASWCAPCAEEAPGLEQAWQNTKDRGVVFVGVDWVDAEDKGLAFMEEHGISYYNGADLGTRIADAYRIRAVPETFIIGKDGKVLFYAPRMVSYEELMSEIEQALAEPAGES